jgi:predicted O-methyltransferase YrrM
MNQFKEAVEQIRKEPIWDFNPAAASTIGEHYALLAVVAREPQVKTIVDIGTWAGTGFLSFRAGNPNVNIQTFDILPWEIVSTMLPSNGMNETIKPLFHQHNFIHKISPYEELIRTADIIFIDIDPHTGIAEKELLNKILPEVKSGCWVMFDDIHLNQGMQTFWDACSFGEKHDLTNIGHYTGTGLIIKGGAESGLPLDVSNGASAPPIEE